MKLVISLSSFLILLGVFEGGGEGLRGALYGAVQKIEIDVSQYLKQVAKSNRQVGINREDINLAKANYHEARDMHSPVLFGRYFNDVDITPFEDTNQLFNVGARAIIPPLGTLLRVEMSNRYGVAFDRTTLTNLMPGEELDATWTSDLLFAVEQPLLQRGLFTGAEQLNINRQKKAIKLQEITYRQRLQSLLMEALTVYWQFDLYQKNLALSKAALEDTQNLLTFMQKRVRLGAVDEVILYDLEALVVNNQDEVILTQKQIRDSSYRITQFMGYTLEVGDDYEVFITDTIASSRKSLNTKKAVMSYKKEAYRYAKMHREDIKQMKLAHALAKAALTEAKFRILPLLNAELRIDTTGRDEEYDLSIEEARDDLEDYNYYIGLRFELPLNPLAYRTAYERALYEERKARKNLSHMEQSILVNIEESINDLIYHHGRTERYEAMVRKMQKRLSLYKKDFRIGKVNTDRLKEAYDTLRSWQRNYLSSLLSYELAYARLQVAEGRFLKDYQIVEGEE